MHDDTAPAPWDAFSIVPQPEPLHPATAPMRPAALAVKRENAHRRQAHVRARSAR